MRNYADVDHDVEAHDDCTCDDPRYVFRVLVEEEEKDRAEVDCTAPTAEQEVDQVTARQMAFVDEAIAQAKPWRCESWCPGCNKGLLVIRSPKPRALNIMERVSAQGVDPNPPVMADCGHAVMATVATRQRMANPDVDNVNVCLPCFNEDPERWRNA